MKKRYRIKSLRNKLEKLWKKYCYLRDGKRCPVKALFPHINTKHSNIYQVDHCFSRNNKELFADVANGTVVCSYCNLNKKYNEAIRLAINDIVIQREGINTFDRMREIASARRSFKDWKNITWLEGQIKILQEMISDVMNMKRMNEQKAEVFDG